MAIVVENSGGITPAEIAVELDRPTPATDSSTWASWESWINQARYLIGKRLDIDTLDPADVDYVVLQSVAEHARHPENATQVDVQVDDGRVSKRYVSGKGRVSILDELWALLDPDLATEAGAFTITPYGSPDPLPYDPWVGA